MALSSDWLSKAAPGNRPSSRGLETSRRDWPNVFKGCPSGQHARPRPNWSGSEPRRQARPSRFRQLADPHSAAALDCSREAIPCREYRGDIFGPGFQAHGQHRLICAENQFPSGGKNGALRL